MPNRNRLRLPRHASASHAYRCVDRRPRLSCANPSVPRLTLHDRLSRPSVPEHTRPCLRKTAKPRLAFPCATVPSQTETAVPRHRRAASGRGLQPAPRLYRRATGDRVARSPASSALRCYPPMVGCTSRTESGEPYAALPVTRITIRSIRSISSDRPTTTAKCFALASAVCARNISVRINSRATSFSDRSCPIET
jgi:hypothetical protein